MSSYIKIGRDIIVGKGWSAKHWAGPVVFGRDAIYLCPNVSQAALMQGWDSAMAATGMLGAIGGALAGGVQKKGDTQPTWQSQVVDLGDLPPEVLNSPDWPVRRRKGPVIVLKHELVEKLQRQGGRLLVTSCGDEFKLGMKLFGRSRVVATVRDLGWNV